MGTIDRFNSGKKAEEHDRVKHSTSDLAASLAITETDLHKIAM